MSTRVLVVDDSHFMRTVLDEELSERGYDVLTARNGEEAVQLVEAYRPDVVTMDVRMPEKNGVEATQEIMDRFPTPVLMLSAHTEADADITLDALDAGAVDFITKPGGTEVSINVEALIDRLVKLIDTATQIDIESVLETEAETDAVPAPDEVATEAAVSTAADTPEVQPRPSDNQSAAGTDTATDAGTSEDRQVVDTDGVPTIVIGASTGGPRIVEQLLQDLPASLNARVLIIQHMPENFTVRLATRLDKASSYDVWEAEHGDTVGAGEAVVAKGGYHLAVEEDTGEELRVRLDESPRQHGLRPAIDVTMETVAGVVEGPVIGIVLTGMGRDGAKGIKAIKRGGGHTIAQDRETSPVFGIPQRAIETGHVDTVLPDTEIVQGVVDQLQTDRGENHD